jgi:3-hydroxyacyl-CoA dehydrogenase
MSRQIRKVAVLGSGVMGSAIAAHFANAGVPALVLDILPPELAGGAQAPASATGADPDRSGQAPDRAARNRVAESALRAMGKARPAALFVPERARLLRAGNLVDDLGRLREVDWVIEAVKEDLGIKKQVLAAAAPHLAPNALLTTNTSGLSLAAMAEVLPADLRPRFLGTHFFNPPRYMKLCELVPAPDTDPDILREVGQYVQDHLGKGVVLAKDTPNFIANRVGIHALMHATQVMTEMGLSIEEIDALTGPAIGRPRTATFQLADLVGLDTFVHVADNLYPLLVDDEARETFKVPDYQRRMVERGLLGRKSGRGFYKLVRTPEKKFYTLDLESLEYRESRKTKSPELEAAKAVEDLPARLRQLVLGKGRVADVLWRLLAPNFSYAAMRLGEICDETIAIDRAMRWGFNWQLGPFETWDALGFRKVAERMRADSLPLPAWVDALYDEGAESIYQERDGVRHCPTAEPGVLVPVVEDPRATDFEILRRSGQEVRRNPGASLLDLGDGVLGLEFHSKMNVVGLDTISMINTACEEAARDWRALVVTNGAENFSVGFNLMLLLMEAQEGNWEEIDVSVRALQQANDRLERCEVPVVVAPHGLTLGGGCEMTMAGDAVRAAAESYIGLVEMGAGVIPAGGGCLRFYRRQVASLPDATDLYPAFRRAFETIGMARVATSAEEARQLGFLRPGDSWSMNRDHLAADAKSLALALARAGYRPPPPQTAIPVMGTAGIGLAEAVLFNLEEARRASAHDRLLGRELARVLSGGELPGPTTVPAQHILDLERESFLRLCGERKTLERMQHILKTGKPLRN